MANRLTTYINESVEELKKVAWPTPMETRNYTFLVIIVSLVVAAFLGVIDMIFTYGFKFLSSRF